jgi:hypothetical protein
MVGQEPCAVVGIYRVRNRMAVANSNVIGKEHMVWMVNFDIESLAIAVVFEFNDVLKN